MKNMEIDTSLLPAKGHYFLFCASLAGILPFGATIASQFGASPALIGTIYLTLQITILLVKPSFGILADKLQQKKIIFLTCLFLTTTTLFAICIIPPVEVMTIPPSLLCQDKSVSIEVCNTQHSEENPKSPIIYAKSCSIICHLSSANPTVDHLCAYHPSYCQYENSTVTILFSILENLNGPMPLVEDRCPSRVFQSFDIFNETTGTPVCFNTTLNSCNISCEDGTISEGTESSAYQVNFQIMYFWIMMVTAYIFMGPATSLGDTIVLSMIPNYEVFGQQRMYGSIGFGLSSIIAGQLVDTFSDGIGQKLNFTPAFCIVLVFGVIDFMVALRFKETKVEKPKHLFKGVGHLFLDAETMLLTTAVFFIGFISGIIWTFLVVYLVSLQASPLLLGLIIGVQCILGEMPFMFISEWFLKKIGHGHSMTLVLAVFGIRFLLYYLVENPWLVLPIETSQGICFGVFFTALATYSSIKAPPSSHATMQGILQAVFEGLGAGAGSFLGGLIYQALGGKIMWLVIGVAACCLAFIHGLILVFIQMRKSHTNEVPRQATDGDEEVKATEMLQMLPTQSANEPNS